MVRRGSGVTRRLTVTFLEHACTWTHPVTLHRPWLWLFRHCPLATLSSRLEDKWETGAWKKAG